MKTVTDPSAMAAAIAGDWHAALAALAWQVDCGVTDALLDAPLDRRAQAPAARGTAPPAPGAPGQETAPAPSPAAPAIAAGAADPVAAARASAGRAATLAGLGAAVAAFDLCELRRGVRSTVFADGHPQARVLILGEAPGRDEDIAGRPFVGRAGRLLDRMFAAIGLSRTSDSPGSALYITNTVFWRPPGNRDPSPDEIAMLLPFVERHIALVAPEVVVTMGNTPLFALTGRRGIMRARGHWTEALGRPLLPMLHPAALLRNPLAKREAWADLLALRERLARAQA